MSYLEELLPEFRKGAKIRCSDWEPSIYIQQQGNVIVNSYDFVCHLVKLFLTGGSFTKSLLTGTTSSRTSAFACFGIATMIIKNMVYWEKSTIILVREIIDFIKNLNNILDAAAPSAEMK